MFSILTLFQSAPPSQRHEDASGFDRGKDYANLHSGDGSAAEHVQPSCDYNINLPFIPASHSRRAIAQVSLSKYSATQSVEP